MPAVWRRIGWVAMAVLIGLSRAGLAETDTVRIQRPIDLATLPLLVAEHEKLIEKAESEVLDHPLSEVLPELDDMMKTAREGTQKLVQGNIVLEAPTSENNLPQRLERAYFGHESHAL